VTTPGTDTPARGASPEVRTSIFYLSLFASSAAGAVLSGLWLHDRGLTTEQIGLVSAVPLFAMLVLNLAVGRIADRAPDWKLSVVVAAALSSLCAAGLFLGHGFWGILLIWSATIIAHSSIIPVIDAAATRLASRRGSDFAAMRGWGTVGYLVVLVATGYVGLWVGPAAFLPLFVGLSVLRTILALQLPRFRAEGASTGGGATRLRHVMKPWFLIPLAGWSVIYGTHTVINAFMGLMWQDQGIGPDVSGLLIAVGALSETAMFFAFRRIGPHFRSRTLILFSAAVTVLRWTAMAFSPSLPWLFVLQSLHGVTYAVGFLACVGFITRWTSDDIAAEAQSFFVMLQQAMAVISLYGFGWLMGHFGAGAWWGAAGFALIGTLAIWRSWSWPQPDGKVA